MADAKKMVDALVRGRRGSAIATTAVLGGVALIVGLAVKALPGSARTDAAPLPPERAPKAAASIRFLLSIVSSSLLLTDGSHSAFHRS